MIGEELDSWTMPITGPWSARITINRDLTARDPKKVKDVYDPYIHDTDEAKMAAIRSLEDWYAGKWQFVRVQVVPLLEHEGRRVPFTQFAQELYSVEWGRMSPDTPGEAETVWGRKEIEVYPVKNLADEAFGELRKVAALLDGAFTD